MHTYLGDFMGLCDECGSSGSRYRRTGIEIYEKHDPAPETRIIWPLNRPGAQLRR